MFVIYRIPSTVHFYIEWSSSYGVTSYRKVRGIPHYELIACFCADQLFALWNVPEIRFLWLLCLSTRRRSFCLRYFRGGGVGTNAPDRDVFLHFWSTTVEVSTPRTQRGGYELKWLLIGQWKPGGIYWGKLRSSNIIKVEGCKQRVGIHMAVRDGNDYRRLDKQYHDLLFFIMKRPTFLSFFCRPR